MKPESIGAARSMVALTRPPGRDLKAMPGAIGAWIGLGTAVGLGLAAGGCAYAARWPSSRLFGAALIAPARAGELALTFDDGPNPAWTPQLLEMLAAHEVRATFFLLGGYAQAEPELVRRIAAAGHVVGNHSWSHPDLALAGRSRIREELTRTRETLEQITGAAVRYFRPPYGSRRPATLAIARELGMRPVLWNAMTADWSETSAERIAARLRTKIDRLAGRGRAANIVLHDGGHLDRRAYRAPSLAAAQMLIGGYRSTHRFVTVDAWE
jgi:peptidoglycan/xylan/chitin deacetylase (PgdA/CDA1 family)